MRSRIRYRAALALLLTTHVVHAEERGFDARSVRPSLDPRAGTSVEPASVPSEGRFVFGAFVGAFKNPLQLGSRKVVSTRSLIDFGVGLVLGKRMLVGLDLPFVLQEARPLAPAVAGVTHSSGAGLGDLGLQGKGVVVDNELGGFGLAALARASLPTGDPATFASERGVTASLAALVDYNLLLAGVQGSLGFRMRSTRADLDTGAAGSARYGNELPFHAAIWIRPSLFKLDPGERQRWEIGVHGSLPAGPSGPFGTGQTGSALLSPVVLRVGDRIMVGRQREVTLSAGFEVGLNGAAIAPSYGLFLGATFFPRNHDRDHDGIEDSRDACPDVPEPMRPGGGERDGCPDVEVPSDRDHDSIPDSEDACPDEAGLATDDLRCHGCAIGDRDHDGVDDHDDACPNVAGPPPTGCPETP